MPKSRGKYGKVTDNQNHLPNTTGEGKYTYFVLARVVPEVTSPPAEGGAPANKLQLPECLASTITERTTRKLFSDGGETEGLVSRDFDWLRLLYSMDFLPSSQTCYAGSTVLRASGSVLGMGSPVPTATRPNKRQLQLAELCGTRAFAAEPQAQAQALARGPELFKLCSGVIPDWSRVHLILVVGLGAFWRGDSASRTWVFLSYLPTSSHFSLRE